MTDMEKRLKEVEASIRMLAEFVRRQADAIDETAGEDYKEEIEKIKESFSDEKELIRLQTRKLDKLEEQVVSITKNPKNKAAEEKMRKTVNDARAELETLRHELLPKVKFIEGKMDTIKEAVEDVHEMHEMKKYLKELERKLESSVANVESELKGVKELTKTDFSENYKANLEKINEAMLARFRDDNAAYFEKLGYIEQRLNAMTEKSAEPNGDILQRMQKLDEKVIGIKESVNNMLSISPEELKDRVDFVDKHVREMRAITNRLRDFDSEIYKEEMDKHVNDLLTQFKNKEFKDVKEVGETLSHFKNMETQDIKKISEMVDEFKTMEVDDIKGLKNIESKDIKKLGSMLEGLAGIEMEDVKRLSKQLKDTRDKITLEEENSHAAEERLVSVEEMIDQLKKSERKFDEHIYGILDHFKELELNNVKDIAKQMKETKEILEEESVNRQSFEKRIMDLESKTEKIDSMEIHDIESLANEMKSAKDALEDESVNRQSMEKRFHTIETEVGQLRGIEFGQENAERVDITKINNRIQDMESNMKLMTVKLLTQQLNEFAKSIDRRLPNIVSREEYLRQIADMQQRLRNIEAPDMAPLGARVERLERKIEEVAGMMRGMYNRIPIIVE
ncbi:MAG: hypothetical protein AABX14_00685 [Candidatus Aenigmatarchaeota archaeon]